MTVFVVIFANDPDYRRTVMRSSYGINFNKVNPIIVQTEPSVYRHTWTIDWPTVPDMQLKNIDCDARNDQLDSWYLLCAEMNSHIANENAIINATVNRIRHTITEAYIMIPLANATEMETDGLPVKEQSPLIFRNTEHSTVDEVKLASSDSNVKIVDNVETHASTSDRWDNPQDSDKTGVNEDDTEIPKWLDESPGDNLEDYIPSFVTGRIFSALLGIPGRDDIDSLKDHLRYVGKAVHVNDVAIVSLERGIASVANILSKRTNSLRDAASIVNQGINDLYVHTRAFYDQAVQVLTKDTYTIFYMDTIAKYFTTNVLLPLSIFKNELNSIDTYVKHFNSGVLRLLSGYVSESLVPAKDMINLIGHVQHQLDKSGRVQVLPSTHYAYYYNLPNVVHTRVRINGVMKLCVHIAIPTIDLNSQMDAYSTTTYRVPTRLGATNAGDGDLSYTIVTDVSEFIAISKDGQTYVELSTKEYITCQMSDKMTMRVCTNIGTGVKHANSKYDSCTYALYKNIPHIIRERCNFDYVRLSERGLLVGFAFQMDADDSFLVHGTQNSEVKESWYVDCPYSPHSPHSVIKPCDMCRISVPCGCSLATDSFYLPVSFSRCTALQGRETELDVRHTINAYVARALLTPTDLERLRVESEFRREKWPNFTLPNITYEIPDQLGYYLQLSHKERQSAKKVTDAVKKEVALFQTREEAYLNKTRDFSDQVVNRAGSVSAAVDELFKGLLGTDVSSAITTIVSPLGFATIAFVISMIMLVRTCIRNRKRDKTTNEKTNNENYELLTIGENKTNDGYELLINLDE